MPNQGGTHEQHVKAGQQSHKDSDKRSQSASAPTNGNKDKTRGGTHEQHVKAGQQSHKNS
ncbi:hypothetical protein O3S81_20855 [Agrobacterium sp. SOY23]|uniref:hypothetical protein n=1 Tax=Agrobacterium sp. SOY23 TaxID=3014555 RepID=UPI0022AF8BBD|nr:hypothetical protein [Agrobacterium sp. SOY23]MCZ4432162.1 hypothetical protein [Agrobacterium sp. SOY23]